MKREKKYLQFYKDYLKTGYIQDVGGTNEGMGGLCNTSIGKEVRSLLAGSYTDNNILTKSAYCLSDLPDIEFQVNDQYEKDQMYKFTSARQNLVLLLAAMNNEL